MTTPAPNAAGPKPTPDRAKTIGDYRVLSKIGSGSFATVWKAVHVRSGAWVAIKAINCEKIRSRPNGPQRFDSEINVMLSMCHDNIVKLLGIHRSHRHIYLIIEYCEQDLSSYLRNLGQPLSEFEAARLLRDLISGLQFLHNHNLAHRDLKPQNLLLTNNGAVLKIADFGFARDTGTESLAETMCGSPLYMSPEILRNDSYDAKIADLWSVGAILFEMVTGQPPYSAQNTVELLRKIESSELQIPSGLSPSCRLIIKGLLNRDARCRLSLVQVRSHPFLNAEPTARGSLTVERSDERVELDDAKASSRSVQDVSESEVRRIIGLISELAQDARDRPEIALALFTRCIQMMVNIRRNIRPGTSSISPVFDNWMARRIDQIGVQCRRLISANRDSMSADEAEINVEQYMYDRSLEIAREAAVGELMGEPADRTLTQLRKATLLLHEVLKLIPDIKDAMAVQVLLHGITVRITNLISRSSSDISTRNR